MATGPAAVIPAPALTPPPTSLIRTATVIEHPDDVHWGGALEWSPEGCGAATAVTQCDQAAKPGAKNRGATIRYEAFGVVAYDSCGTFGFPSQDYEGRARRLLAARESKAVEAEWWTGALISTNPHLAMTGGTNGPNAVTLSGGTAQPLRLGLALLTQYLADLNGGMGMIHARPLLVEMWFGLQLLYRDAGGKLYTGLGNQVVAGSGYPGTGPTGQAVTATSEWAFATDNVEVHRGPVSVLGPGAPGITGTDLINNAVVARAERLYALTSNGCVNGAVNINPAETA